MAVHRYFQDEGFCFIHTPVLTQNDCEGAGEVFSVEVKGKLAEKLLKESDEPDNDLEDDKPSAHQHNENIHSKTDHFFGAPVFLTVSGHLHLESAACGLGRVYNFGPAFRAEGSKSRLHASEFQMIEAEVPFMDNIEDLMTMVDKCIKKIVESLMTNCPADIHCVIKDIKGHDSYIQNLLSKYFVRLTYNEALEILLKNKKKIKVPIKAGDDICTEHKQLLVKHCGNIPVFVSMFPSSSKAFYMKSIENQACSFDLFAAFGGEICDGGLREEDANVLQQKFDFEQNRNLSWYLDLKKFGSVPVGGFGIGFERLLQSILGIPNIRDVIFYPRRRNDCKS